MMAMSAVDVWITTGVLTLVIVVLRNAFLVAPRAWLPRGIVEHALRYAPLAALVALVAPEVLSSLLSPAARPGAAGLPALLATDPRVVSALALIVLGRVGGNPVVALGGAAALYVWMS